MMYYDMVIQLANFIEKEWGKPINGSNQTVSLVAGIIDSCEGLDIGIVSHINKEQFRNLKHIDKKIRYELSKIDQIHSVPKNNSRQYQSNRIKTKYGSNALDTAMQELNNGIDKFTSYINALQIDPKPRGKIKRKELILHLYSAYENNYGGVYIKRNSKQHHGKRAHNDFTKVAIIFDRLFGNPSNILKSIPYEINGSLNLTALTSHNDTDEIHSFAIYIEAELSKQKSP